MDFSALFQPVALPTLPAWQVGVAGFIFLVSFLRLLSWLRVPKVRPRPCSWRKRAVGA
jgi:hypothetical protein